VQDSLRLGRIAGITVGLHWTVLGMGALVTAVLAAGVLPTAFPGYPAGARWTAAAAGAVVFGASLLAHELGHALVARRHGVGVDGITLWLLGGLARLDRPAPTPAAEARIALAGPLVSGLIGVVLVAVAVLTRDAAWAPLARAVALWLGLVNVLLAGFNLLPGAPLDGGRVLAAVLWRRSGDAERARLLAGRAGLVLGVTLTAFGLFEVVAWRRVTGVGTAAIGVFLVGAARAEIASAVIRGRLARVTMGEVMSAHPPAVPDSATVEQFLRWPGIACGATVFPVTRWDHRPIGWLSIEHARATGAPEHSWVRVGELMVPDASAARAWATESVDRVLDRLHDRLPHLLIVLDPRSGAICGTVGAAQLGSLFSTPDLWGRRAA
jgi:Zn-dependent protease